MFSGTLINVNAIEARMADLRQRLKACLKGREVDALSSQEKSIYDNILSQLGFCSEQLREHQAGAYIPGFKQPGEFRFVADAGHEDEGPQHKKTISRFLQSIFANANDEQRLEIKVLAGYLRGRPLATADLRPSGDGSVIIPSFVQSVIERAYTAFSPVANVARLFPTETGADITYPVVDDTESAEQLDAAAETGADDSVSGDTPPTSLTGPTFKAYKVSSKPVFVPRETETDTELDIVQEVIGALMARILRFENLRFTKGTGVSQAEGFLHACSTHEGTGT